MENLETSVPVAEQVNEINQVEQAIQTEYALDPSGTIVKATDLKENPESFQDNLV